MAIKLGSSDISKVYLGATEVSKIYLGSTEVYSAASPFITTWRTTGTNETITIPTTGAGYNYDITTSDGQTFTGETGDKTITFATAGDYDVEISGDFPRIYFNNGGDNLKLVDIVQWGSIAWTSFSVAFYGCNSLTTTSVTDAPDLSNVTDISNMFLRCQELITLDFSNWDVSNVTNMSNMLQRNLDLTTLAVSNWDVSNVTNMNQMLRNTDSITDYLLSNWNINKVTDFGAFMVFTGMSTSSYDAILIGWEATLQTEFPSGTGYTPTISIDFGGSKYTGGGAAATARSSLVSNFGWTIVDGGIA